MSKLKTIYPEPSSIGTADFLKHGRFYRVLQRLPDKFEGGNFLPGMELQFTESIYNHYDGLIILNFRFPDSTLHSLTISDREDVKLIGWQNYFVELASEAQENAWYMERYGMTRLEYEAALNKERAGGGYYAIQDTFFESDIVYEVVADPAEVLGLQASHVFQIGLRVKFDGLESTSDHQNVSFNFFDDNNPKQDRYIWMDSWLPDKPQWEKCFRKIG